MCNFFADARGTLLFCALTDEKNMIYDDWNSSNSFSFLFWTGLEYKMVCHLIWCLLFLVFKLNWLSISKVILFKNLNAGMNLDHSICFRLLVLPKEEPSEKLCIDLNLIKQICEYKKDFLFLISLSGFCKDFLCYVCSVF